MLSILSWLAATLAVIGTVLNVYKKRSGFLIWILTNGFFVVYNYGLKAYAQAALFAVYTGISLWGFIRWGRSNPKGKTSTSDEIEPWPLGKPRHEPKRYWGW